MNSRVDVPPVGKGVVYTNLGGWHTFTGPASLWSVSHRHFLSAYNRAKRQHERFEKLGL